MKSIAHKMNISLEKLQEGIDNTARFYGVEDFDNREKLPLFILAKVRDLNDDGLNLYKNGSFYKVSYEDKTESFLDDDNLYVNLFKFFDENNLNYRID